MCIDIVEIWFGIANGQISSNFDSYELETRSYFRFRMITLKRQGILPKLGTCIYMKESWFLVWSAGLKGLNQGDFIGKCIKCSQVYNIIV